MNAPSTPTLSLPPQGFLRETRSGRIVLDTLTLSLSRTREREPSGRGHRSGPLSLPRERDRVRVGNRC